MTSRQLLALTLGLSLTGTVLAGPRRASPLRGEAARRSLHSLVGLQVSAGLGGPAAALLGDSLSAVPDFRLPDPTTVDLDAPQDFHLRAVEWMARVQMLAVPGLPFGFEAYAERVRRGLTRGSLRNRRPDPASGRIEALRQRLLELQRRRLR